MGVGQFSAPIYSIVSAIRFVHQAVHLLVFLDEISVVLFVFDCVSRIDDLLRVFAEDIEHGFFVVSLKRGDECVGGVFRRGEGLLALLLSQGKSGRARSQKDSDRG
jgi:hypothetical protein